MKNFFDDVDEMEMAPPLPPRFLAAYQYAVSLLMSYGPYLSASAGEMGPGDEWKREAEGPPVERGALAGLIAKVSELPRVLQSDEKRANAYLKRICDLLIPLLETRLENIQDPVGRFAIADALGDLRSFTESPEPSAPRPPARTPGRRIDFSRN